MKCAFFMVLSMFFFVLEGNAQPRPKKLLRQVQDSISKLTSLNYSIHHSIKFFDEPDTLKTRADVVWKRNPRDKELGFSFCQRQKNLECYYNGQQFVSLRSGDSNATVVPQEHDPASFVTGGASERTIADFLFQPRPYQRLTKKDCSLTVTIDSSDRGTSYYIRGVYDDNADPDFGLKFTNEVVEIWIDSATMLPFRTRYNVDMDETQHQYTEANITYREINSTIPDTAFAPVIPSWYKVSHYKGYERPKLLENKSAAPDFNFTNLQGDSIKLSDYLGKLVLLDFWYRSCAPCLGAMPSLQELHEEYGEQGLVVIGVNPYDKPQEVEESLKTKGISYQLAFVSQQVSYDFYKVTAYPTFYLIGPDGTILHSEVGYGKGSHKALKWMIRLTLKEMKKTKRD